MKRPLFVYGSLMRGEELNGYLAGLPCQAARTRGQLFRMPAGYPALHFFPEGDWVKGELLSLQNMARFTVLDLIEGVDRGLYKRVQIPIETETQKLMAWAYTMDVLTIQRRQGVLIPNGDWRSVPRARPKP